VDLVGVVREQSVMGFFRPRWGHDHKKLETRIPA